MAAAVSVDAVAAVVSDDAVAVVIRADARWQRWFGIDAVAAASQC